jgi:microcompartment protein CcmL/EutN
VLTVGLVLAATVVVALVAHAALGLSWSAAFVLGAVVSPTDAVAASATAQHQREQHVEYKVHIQRPNHGVEHVEQRRRTLAARRDNHRTAGCR